MKSELNFDGINGIYGIGEAVQGIGLTHFDATLAHMLKYSEVALKITGLKEPKGREVTKHLGIAPTLIQEAKGHVGSKETLHYFWQLDSPKDQNFAFVVRLEVLLDLIAPFSERLISLDSRYKRWIDIVFHVTPQREGGTINGEFDWFMMDPSLMTKMGAWNLRFSYEKFWFEEEFYKLRMESKLHDSPRQSVLQKLFGKRTN